jgi:tRNA(adenine34) deaminase
LGRIINLVEIFLTKFNQIHKDNKIEIPSYTQIFFADELISESLNQVELESNTTKHSEIICIELAQRKLKQKFLTHCTLITLIEPCLMCSGAIISSRVDKVIYLLESKKIPGLSTLSFESIYSENHFPEVYFCFSQEAEEILKSFFKNSIREGKNQENNKR